MPCTWRRTVDVARNLRNNLSQQPSHIHAMRFNTVEDILKPSTFELKHCTAKDAPMLLNILLCNCPYNARQCIFHAPLTFIRLERPRSLNRLLRTVPRNARNLRDKQVELSWQ